MMNRDKAERAAAQDYWDKMATAPDEMSRENRTLRWKLKQLGKQCGRQGQTIYELRNEVAALREAVKVDWGGYRRLLEEKRAAHREIARLEALIDALDEPIAYLPLQNDNCIGETVGENA